MSYRYGTDFDTSIVHGGRALRQSEATEWFRKVADPTNWKNPIDTYVDPADLPVLEQVVTYFTGSILQQVSGVRKSGPNQGKVRVQAVGYYLAIGA